MEILHTETNRDKKAIIVDGYVYRQMNTLKNGDIVYVRSANKKCNKSITTDPDSSTSAWSAGGNRFMKPG